jgi:hypothetical protein
MRTFERHERRHLPFTLYDDINNPPWENAHQSTTIRNYPSIAFDIMILPLLPKKPNCQLEVVVVVVGVGARMKISMKVTNLTTTAATTTTTTQSQRLV